MEELKKRCQTCSAEKNIIEIIRDEHGGSDILFSCGHREAGVIVCDTLTLIENLYMKHINPTHSLIARDKTKISGKSKHPALDSIKIDRERRVIIHKVWEKNEDGTLELVHCEEKHFKSNDE